MRRKTDEPADSRAIAGGTSSRKKGPARPLFRALSAGRSLLLCLELLHPSLELLHHGRVAERGHVSQLAALGDVAQEPAHDLPGSGLGQVVGPDDPVGPGELADPLGALLPDLLD